MSSAFSTYNVSTNYSTALNTHFSLANDGGIYSTFIKVLPMMVVFIQPL